MIQIEYDFLDQEEFIKLQTIIMGRAFYWSYNDTIDYEGQKDKFMFNHMFYFNGAPCSRHFNSMLPLLEIINPISIGRIKANLLTRTSNIIEYEFHVDMVMPEEKQKQWTISIFYMNTNNGYSEFEDGTKVESVANRMVTFPANVKHTGTSCTDEKTRVMINFNYFSRI